MCTQSANFKNENTNADALGKKGVKKGSKGKRGGEPSGECGTEGSRSCQDRFHSFGNLRRVSWVVMWDTVGTRGGFLCLCSEHHAYDENFSRKGGPLLSGLHSEKVSGVMLLSLCECSLCAAFSASLVWVSLLQHTRSIS